MEKHVKGRKHEKSFFSKVRLAFSKTAVRLMKNRGVSTVVRFTLHLFEDDIFGIAAQTTYFLLLSIFPFFLVILASLSRLEMNLNFELLEFMLPPSVLDLLSGIFSAAPPDRNMTLLPLILALFSASTAIWALMGGISRSFTGERLNRPIWQRFVAFVFMLGFLAAVAVSLVLWFYGNYLLVSLEQRLGDGAAILLGLLRHLALFLWLFVFIFSLYRYTPGLRKVKAKSMLPGAALAAVGWSAASWGFEIYMRLFNNYALLYGQVGAVLGLVIWLYIISVILLFGAELNAFLLRPKKDKRPYNGI